jgi:rhodanese-related sulfurtransferase
MTKEVRRVSAAEAYALLGTGRAVLVDVRNAADYEAAHAEGAISAPHVAVQALGGRLPPGSRAPDDAQLILYCR